MSNFTVRIELHNADSSDYEQLHEKMETNGFSRTIKSDAGVTYCLPTAEYNYSSPLGHSDVLKKAFSLAKLVQPNPSVLVTESSGRSWNGLTIE